VAAVVSAGCLILGWSIQHISMTTPPTEWWVLAVLTLFTGSAVLKIPGAPVNFSISDVFTLTAAVVFGPAAGTVIVALDSLAISARLRRAGLPRERILFNAAGPPLAMWVSAQVFFAASGVAPLYVHPRGLEVVGPWLLLFAGLYFLLNTFAIAVAIALHERAGVITIWRAHFQNLWFTFIGGGLGAAFVVFALQLGTYGLVLLSVPLLLAFILHFAYRNATGRVADQLQHLAEVNRLHLSTIEALAHAIDAKDAVTHGHIRRVQRWAVDLAGLMGVTGEIEVRALEAAALLHDIGKLAIPEHILNKPGKLTAPEFERMKTHARVGAEILSEIDFPYPVVPIVRHHHENWDGTGYPDGIAGEAIPIGARILSVVDCFDALTSDRPYRRALSGDSAFAIIEARAGTMYDPAVVAAFRTVCAPSTLQASDSERGEQVALAPAMSSPAVPFPVDGATRDEVAVVLGLGVALSGVSASGNPWSVVATALRSVPHVDAVAVFVAQDTEQRLVAVATAGAHDRSLAHLSIPIGERLSGWVAAVKQPMINADAALDLFDVAAGSLCCAVAACCPRTDGSRIVLTLYSSHPGVFSPFHVRLLSEVVALVDRSSSTAADLFEARLPAS
jgi:putative nucleotidyltransferase with HDIG domain